MKIRLYTLLLCIIISVPQTLSAREFLNTIMHINFGVIYGSPYGDIIDAEYDGFYIDDGDDREHPDHNELAFGVTIDFVPFDPWVLGVSSHAFKLGIRGAYRFSYIKQSLSVSDDETYEGDLMQFQCWMVGPVIHYAPVIEASGLTGEYTAGGGFTFFALIGKLRSGTLTAYPAKRDKGEPVSDYETSLGGIRMDVGVGAEISVCSVNLGLNLFYSYLKLNLGRAIYPDVGEKTSLHEACVEVYMGIPIEWISDPAIL